MIKAPASFAILLSGAPSSASLSPTYRAYILLTLSLVQVLALVDRNILAVLLVPIQRDIGVSDTAMGLLTGTAFAVFYATAAIPVSRLADRGNRRNLIAAALTIWSAATSLCGLAASYVHLLIARIGVAAAESAASPAIMSMIPDLFPRERRATAIGVTLAATSFSVFIGSFAGGWLNDRYGWHVAFMVIGLPGLLLALLIWRTVPEPVRGTFDGPAKAPALGEGTWRQLARLARIPTAPLLILAKCCVQMGQFAWLSWIPALLIRSHGMTTTEMGLIFGATATVGGVVANLAAGAGSDYLARRGVRWYFYWCAAGSLATAPLALGFLMTPVAGTALVAFLAVYFVVMATVNPPLFTASITIVPPTMRALMTAVIYFCTNMVGVGLGPLVIGLLSDGLKPIYGEDALRYALLIVPAAYLLAGGLFLIGSRTLEADAKKAIDPNPC